MGDKAKTEAWKSFIATEASAGISFSNLFIAIGIALIGLVVSNSGQSAIPLLLVEGSVLIVSGFYASICYANTHGRIRNENNSRSFMLKPIIWGNAISEYLGVYFLNMTIPSTIWSFTGDPLYTRVSYMIVIIGFVVYHLSNFDLLERLVKKRVKRFLVAAVFSTLIAVSFEFFIMGKILFAYASAACFAVFAMSLAALHILKVETPGSKTN